MKLISFRFNLLDEDLRPPPLPRLPIVVAIEPQSTTLIDDELRALLAVDDAEPPRSAS